MKNLPTHIEDRKLLTFLNILLPELGVVSFALMIDRTNVLVEG